MTGTAVRMPGDVGAGGHDVGGALGGHNARRVRRHRCHDRDASPAGLSCQHAAGVSVPARSERRTADEHVGVQLLEPPEQRRERLALVLAEEIVATGEGDVGRRTRRRERASRALRAIQPDGLVSGGLLAAEPREELIDVVDDRHAGTAVQDASPVSTHAATYAQVGTGSPTRAALGEPITRPGVHGSTSSSSLPVLTRQSASGT